MTHLTFPEAASLYRDSEGIHSSAPQGKSAFLPLINYPINFKITTVALERILKNPYSTIHCSKMFLWGRFSNGRDVKLCSLDFHYRVNRYLESLRQNPQDLKNAHQEYISDIRSSYQVNPSLYKSKLSLAEKKFQQREDYIQTFKPFFTEKGITFPIGTKIGAAQGWHERNWTEISPHVTLDIRDGYLESFDLSFEEFKIGSESVTSIFQGTFPSKNPQNSLIIEVDYQEEWKLKMMQSAIQ